MASVTNNTSPYTYDSWKNNSIRSVNWECLPETRTLKWHEVTKTRNIVGNVFLSLSSLTAAAALFTATASLAIASLAFASLSVVFLATGVYLRKMKDHELDPDFRMNKRNQINSLQPKIPHVITLNSLVSRFIITCNEKQVLLHQDIYATDYNDFVVKHSQRIFDELDKTNIDLLKLKFLDYLSKCEITDPQTILQSHANRYFLLTEADLAPFLPKVAEEEEKGVEAPASSMLSNLASKASTYVGPAVKFAVNTFVPLPLRAAGQFAMASAQSAYEGKAKQSMFLAANAATYLLIHSTKAMLSVLYPEASQVVKQQMMYEKARDVVL